MQGASSASSELMWGVVVFAAWAIWGLRPRPSGRSSPGEQNRLLEEAWRWQDRDRPAEPATPDVRWHLTPGRRSRWELRNVGSAPAHDVHLEGGHPLRNRFPQTTVLLPRETLEVPQPVGSWDAPAPEAITVRWSEASGATHEELVTLTTAPPWESQAAAS